MRRLKRWWLNRQFRKISKDHTEVRHFVLVNGAIVLSFAAAPIEDKTGLVVLLEEVLGMLKAPEGKEVRDL